MQINYSFPIILLILINEVFKRINNLYSFNDQQFSRSCVGGNTVATEFPTDLDENESKDVDTSNNVFLLTKVTNVTDTNTDLHFESRFESGNLCKVVKITDTYYQLYLRKDLYTQRHTQWYYFRISNTRSRTNYRWIFQIWFKFFY